jgi:hypothetical protein
MQGMRRNWNPNNRDVRSEDEGNRRKIFKLSINVIKIDFFFLSHFYRPCSGSSKYAALLHDMENTKKQDENAQTVKKVCLRN